MTDPTITGDYIHFDCSAGDNAGDRSTVTFPAFTINGTTYVYIKKRNWQLNADEGGEIVLKSTNPKDSDK